MLLEEYNYEEDLAVNREEAHEEGQAEGERQMGLLMERLYDEGRADDVKLALRDDHVRERLYAEYGIEIKNAYQCRASVPDKHALEQAVKECREKGILADYLARNGSEVVNMLLEEYSYEEEVAINRGEAYEEGRAEGERRMGLLMERLYGEGRTDDAKLALRDDHVRERLYAEYGI